MMVISKRRVILVLSLLLILTQTIMGQERKPLTGIINEKIGLFDGPGNTYKPVATLDVGAALNVRGRTEAGNWLYVTLDRAEPLEGWTLTGYVTLPEETAFSRVPVIRAYPDANVDNVFDPLLKELYAVPILPVGLRHGRGRHPCGVRRLPARRVHAARGFRDRAATQDRAVRGGRAAANVLHLLGP